MTDDSTTTPAETKMSLNEVPILVRRQIEALLLKHVLAVITERSSRAEAEAVIGEVCSKSAIEQGQMLAEDLGRTPDLKDFMDILPNWTREDALKLDVLQASEDSMDFNVLRCRYAEMYKEMGLGDIGHLLSCNRDGDFCIGYNPDIELTRTQTIMKGASHCDFRYRLKKDAR